MNDLLEAAVANAPDPEQARRLAESVLAAAAASLEGTRPDRVAHVLHALCGVAPFFATWLVREPAWLAELAADDLATTLDRAALAAQLDADLAAAGPDIEDAQRALRRFKYRWLARIVVRDCALPLEASGETLIEQSHLAEILLDGALRISRARVTAQLGPPQWRDAQGHVVPASFCVLGLGKLGGEELNFSSDVDLIYVYSHVADATNGPQERAPLDWFMRLGQEFARLVAAETEDRFLYRIDLDLRPEGDAGPPAISDTMLAEYYENAADHWEKVAFMKARPVAGDLELGWAAVRAIHPMIYRAAMDYAGVRRIRSLQQRVGEKAKRGADDGFDVKLDPGGIRDVEFVSQALQLLHGGRIPQLRDRSALRALSRLAETHVLPAATAEALRSAYLFLRRVENRLQMEDERQVHELPRRPEARLRLSRAMGYRGATALADFEAELARQRECARAFGASFHADDSDAILQLFVRHQPQLLARPATRSMMEALAERFARAIEASPDVVLALNNLDRFVAAIGGRRFYYELLLDRPELVGRLAALFAGSRFLSSLLAQHPRLIEPLFADPNLLLLTREQLRADLASLRAELGAPDEPDFELDLEALRLFHHRQVLNVGLLDIGGKIGRAACEGALTEIAEVALEAALAVAQREVARVRAERGVTAARFLVVGMGKLASRELTYGSDLDLIFLYDLPAGAAESDPLDAQEQCVRVAQRLISALETQTASGSCYEIDSRLRPSGNQGTLVTSLASLRGHYEGTAMLWEKQALLRARPVAGDAASAAAFEALRDGILRRPLPGDAAGEIHRIRLRMERELAEETSTRRDLKRGRGGLLDVENAVQFLQLKCGRDHPALLVVDRTERQIEKLAAFGVLSPAQAEVLREGWEFLERLASRLRVVENRSISDLDEERGDLDGLARRLGYGGGARESSARRALLDDYSRHTRAIRAAYLEILGVSRSEEIPAAR